MRRVPLKPLTEAEAWRRARAAAAIAYGLAPGGRQKVRFRRWMRAVGDPRFARGDA